MEYTPNSRRDFLKRLGAAGVLGIGAGSVLSACGGGEAGDQAESSESQAMASCMDTSGLTEQEISMRNSLEYVDQSPVADKNCANCSLYVQAEAGETCGGCSILKGPIHPDGYCISWAPAQA